MVKTVREADTNKVDDCKDDIDTLLVFVSITLLFGHLNLNALLHRPVSTPQCSPRLS